MCISLAAAAIATSLITAAAGTALTIDSTIKQAGYAEIQLAEQQKQLRAQRDAQRLQGLEAEQLRLEQFRRAREANLASLAADGTGQNMSFFQGIAKAEQQALRKDLRNIRIATLGGENRLASEIRVNRLESSANKASRNASILGSGINFLGNVASAYGSYEATRGGSTPSSSSSSGSGTGDWIGPR
jgi:hypothetical protein